MRSTISLLTATAMALGVALTPLTTLPASAQDKTVTLGVLGAFALTRFLSSLLFNVSATDLAAFVTGPFVLAAVALLACWVPAQRATRVDPASVLKQD